MAPTPTRRRRKVATGIVRFGAVLSVVFVTALVLHHPVALVLHRFARLADGRGGSISFIARAGRTGSAEGRYSNEERLLQDSFLTTNAGIVDGITALCHALVHPPKRPVAAGGNGVGCLPDYWTGNPGDYNLTRAAVACVADSHNVVMVTTANWHYLDFVRNWVHHVRQANISNFLVGATDHKVLEALAADGVSAFSLDSGTHGLGDFGWGSKTFHKSGRLRIGLIDTFTRMNFSILASDVDTVWLRNPLPFMAAFPQADILTSTDHLRVTALDGGLEWPHEAVHTDANIGIMLVRAHANAFAEEWLTIILKDEKYWDQHAFNDLMRRGIDRKQRRADRLFAGYDKKLLFGILPVATFCSGHAFFVQHMPEKMGLLPYVAHATFQFSGTPGKRHRFREALLWNDPPKYFGGRYLAYKPDIPSDLLRAATPPDRDDPQQNMTHIAPQFDLIHHQLKQLRSAWAIAQVLNRTLVLPELWSGQDRYWGPHNGRFPGSVVDLPFMAPADHILELADMMRPRTEAEFGPNMDFREHSFLRNPRMPAVVRRSRVHIAVCQPDVDERLCNDGSRPAYEAAGRVRLRRHLKDRQLLAALKVFKDRRLMLFDTMLDTFDGFEDANTTRRFHKRLRDVPSIFCCIKDGHVPYDMLYDVVPHTDKWGRNFTKQWRPILRP